MLWARWMIYGVPSALAALAVWSAHEAALSRVGRSNEIIIASTDSIAPSLNPLLPVSEVDREIAALAHEPLLRIGADGHIAPALAEGWFWNQTSHAWFANEDYARQAAAKLGALSETQRAALGITSIQTMDNELRLTISKPGAQIEAGVMPVIASCGPMPVEHLRIEMNEDARIHHEFFMKNAVERSQVKSVWFDGSRACELAVSGETMKFAEELTLFYQNHPALQAQIHTLGKSGMLHEPVLELVMRKEARFSDGTEASSEDARATLALVLGQPWPVRGRDALQMALQWDATDPRILRATFKEFSGSAIMALTGLPVLPSRWITKHLDALKGGENPFPTDPPPGAGRLSLESTSARAISLTGARRVRFMLDQTPRTVRMGFAMGEVDAYWPSWHAVADPAAKPTISLCATAPRNRLLVLWNCRKPPLDDPRVREALGLAVDREAMVRDLLHGEAVVQEGIFQPGLWFAQKNSPDPCDPAKAAALLEEAGWKRAADGPLMKNGTAFHLELLTLAGNTERAGIAEQLSKAWAGLGITVAVSSVTPDELVNLRLPEHRFDASLLGLDFEMGWDQIAFWHSSQAQGGLNFCGIADRDLDEMLVALRAEYDPERVPDLAHAVEDHLMDLHPFLPLFAGGSLFAIRTELLPPALRSGPVHPLKEDPLLLVLPAKK